MKRRASQQLIPESSNKLKSQEKVEEKLFSQSSVTDSEALVSDSETCPSDRKKFKAKRNTGKEAKVEENSENFLKLLAELRDPDCVQKTNERIARLEEDCIEKSTPRKIVPSGQKDFEKVASFQVKLRSEGKNLGKGELQVLKFFKNQNFFIVFRNCIQKVLFNGLVFKQSKVHVLETCCKEKHSGKIDLEVTLLRQPEGKFCRIVVCAEDEQVKALENEMKQVLNKINRVEEEKVKTVDN